MDFVENLNDEQTDKSLCDNAVGSAKPNSISGVNQFHIIDTIRL